MIFWMIVLLFAAPAALLTAHHGILWLAGEEEGRAFHMKRASIWAGVLIVLVMVVNGLYGYPLMLAIVGWGVYQFVRLSDAMAARLSE